MRSKRMRMGSGGGVDGVKKMSIGRGGIVRRSRRRMRKGQEE